MRKTTDCTLNFVYAGLHNWQEIITGADLDTSLDALAPYLLSGREVWVIQTFYVLRERGHSVVLSSSFREDCVNIVHADDIAGKELPFKYFIVSIRADKEPSFRAHNEIVQNHYSIWRSTDIYIPHWPQPGLLPRDTERGGKLENIVFIGKKCHLADELQSSFFCKQLEKIGLKLRIQENNWWNYKDADIVLAVRRGYPFYRSIKPASKLVNAWNAGCPAILGKESGYQELMSDSLDYFEASSAEQVLDCIQQLLNSETLHDEMIQHGLKRGKAFSVDAIATHWETALYGPILDSFARWGGHARSTHISKNNNRLIKAKERIWGTQAMQFQSSKFKELQAMIRRAMVLPRSAYSKIDKPVKPS